ncbi:MAG: PQQ-binding-like beta-propeller repeat protein, partial [Chloroflexota bacterium]
MLAALLSSAASWPEYLGNGQHTAASTDAAISVASAAQLRPLWSFQTGGVVAAEPIVVQGTVYVGSWDGYEYALDAATGALKWKTLLGKTAAAGCVPPAAGITSTAAVSQGVVYVGGGDAFWYALDAATGAVLWKVPTGDNSPAGGHYNWSSPLLYHGYAYIGTASFGDCPLVQGQLLQVNLATHRVVHTLNLVPTGQVGAGLWTSPAVDPASNTIFLTSGSDQGNVQQPYGQAIVAVNASTLAIIGHWTLPAAQTIDDSDWGDSPLLASGPSGRPLLFATNKNGYVYGFDRANLAAGYLWRTPIADPGTCPSCGDTSVSSGAFGQGRLYMGGGHAAVAGRGHSGTVLAIDPASGAILWTHAAPGPVIGPLAYANGLVIDGAGPTLEVLDAATGERLYSWNSPAQIYGGPTVAKGVLYASSTSGSVFALRLAAHPTA